METVPVVQISTAPAILLDVSPTFHYNVQDHVSNYIQKFLDLPSCGLWVTNPLPTALPAETQPEDDDYEEYPGESE